MREIRSSELPPSKSLYNRALILQSFEPELKIQTNSLFEAEDSLLLKKALEDFSSGKKEFYCGAGAGPLKFLAIRLSREEGHFTIRGTERLFSRPLLDLKTTLESLGSNEVVLSSDSISFHSKGEWPNSVSLNTEGSSQLLSALLLSSWDLAQNLEMQLETDVIASESYLDMTLNLMLGAAWSGELKKEEEKLKAILLPKKQFVVLDELFIEPDMSSAAALALVHVLKEGISFKGMLPSSLQGDVVIFSLLREMGYAVEITQDKEIPESDIFSNLPQLVKISISKVELRKGLSANLFSTPDLFPVLAAFVATASSPSEFKGLKNLNSKESKRLDKMKELLSALGLYCESGEDFLRINPIEALKADPINFNPDQDHRLAMAAHILNVQGAKITLQNPDVVSKSFPNFWDMT